MSPRVLLRNTRPRREPPGIRPPRQSVRDAARLPGRFKPTAAFMISPPHGHRLLPAPARQHPQSTPPPLEARNFPAERSRFSSLMREMSDPDFLVPMLAGVSSFLPLFTLAHPPQPVVPAARANPPPESTSAPASPARRCSACSDMLPGMRTSTGLVVFGGMPWRPHPPANRHVTTNQALAAATPIHPRPSRLLFPFLQERRPLPLLRLQGLACPSTAHFVFAGGERIFPMRYGFPGE